VSRIRAFALFWWDFVVGDDWRVAAGLALAIAAIELLHRVHVAAWWLLPLAVAAVLGLSVARYASRRRT
jgi:hypothetical protein